MWSKLTSDHKSHRDVIYHSVPTLYSNKLPHFLSFTYRIYSSIMCYLTLSRFLNYRVQTIPIHCKLSFWKVTIQTSSVTEITAIQHIRLLNHQFTINPQPLWLSLKEVIIASLINNRVIDKNLSSFLQKESSQSIGTHWRPYTRKIPL